MDDDERCEGVCREGGGGDEARRSAVGEGGVEKMIMEEEVCAETRQNLV